MTLKEAWEASGKVGVRLPGKGTWNSHEIQRICLDDAISDKWEPFPPPEPEKLTLAQALRKWKCVRRASWATSDYVTTTRPRCIYTVGELLIGDLEATDWVEAKP